ncbi:MAG: DUF4832 domain-containing protein [Clostridiaceae bacterium]|nr:DUF4832 domain-containing protein [Clostridiaceae bacterium]
MKTRRIFALILALVFLLLSLPQLPATAEIPALQTITYTPDFKTIFPNPERGFCQYVNILDPKFILGMEADDQYFSYRPYLPEGAAEVSASRIIHSYIRLDKYGDTPQLPQELLDSLAGGLAAVRREGMKADLRCAYSMTMEWVRDIPIETIMSHMKQINKVISANADVVFAIEAGYFGPWGEWHDNIYTTWQDRNGEANPAGKDARAALVKGILETTPEHVKVAIRYYDYLDELLKNDIFTQAEKDRLGMHCDGIGNNPAIGGNYPDFHLQTGLKYVADLATSDGFHRFYGGETGIDEVNGYIDGYEFLDEVYAENVTEYNGSWSIPQRWLTTKLPASGNDPAETTYQRFLRKIGYRLRLVNATFKKSADPGDTFDFSAVIDNDGYAGPINPRPVYLVFDNGTTRRNVRLNGVEVRSWLGGDDHTGPYNIEAKDIKVPADLAAGDYTLALWLPDSSVSLQSRSEYSIRLANKYMWDAQKGYNKLGVVTVGLADPGIPSWAVENVTSAVSLGVATPDLCNNYTSATTRAEFCRAAVNLLEQYYSLPAAGIIHKRDFSLLEQPFGYWIGDTAKNSGDPNERIEGFRSMVGRSNGSSEWNPIILTNLEQIPLKAGGTYEVRFKYKIIETPDKGFYTVFCSAKGDAAGFWLPGAEIRGKAGDTDEVVMTRTLGPYEDYYVYWNIPGKGAVAIDSITITEKGAKAPIASFDFEIPPLNPEPSTGSYSLSAKEMCDIHTWLGLQTGDIEYLEQRRGMLTTMPSFTDTSDPAIRAAAALGITSGTGNGTFSPNAPLTREQAATMLTNVLKIIGENTSSAPAVKWKDDKSISSYAQTAADVMYQYKIMQGTSTTALVFSPKSPYTHVQSILTLNSLWKYLEGK